MWRFGFGGSVFYRTTIQGNVRCRRLRPQSLLPGVLSWPSVRLRHGRSGRSRMLRVRSSRATRSPLSKPSLSGQASSPSPPTIRRRRPGSCWASACSRTRNSPRPEPSPAPPATIQNFLSVTASPGARASPASVCCGTRPRSGTLPSARCCSGTAGQRAWKSRCAFPSNIPTRWATRSTTLCNDLPGTRATSATSPPLSRTIPNISARNITRALTVYERTLISPPTRFDHWVAGDAEALHAAELHGLKLFTGKAAASAATPASLSPTTTSTTSACRRRQGPRQGDRPARRRLCVQDADAARVRLDRALHARRRPGDPGGRRCASMRGRRRAPHAQQGSARNLKLTRRGASGSRSPSWNPSPARRRRSRPPNPGSAAVSRCARRRPRTPRW